MEIQSAGERAAALTRQLLAFSRRQMLQPQVVDINTLVQAAREAAAPADQRGRRARDGRSRRTCGRSASIRRRSSRCSSTSPSTRATRCRAAGSSRSRPANVELDEAYARDARRDAPGPVRDAGGQRHRRRHGRGDARAHLRAVLHDEGAGQGQRPRPGDRLRHREAERRLHLGLQRAGHGTVFKVYLPPAQTRAVPRADRSRGQRRQRRTAGKPCCSSRTRTPCGRSRARCCAATATSCSRRGTAWTRCASPSATRTTIHLLVTDVVMPHMSGREAGRAPEHGASEHEGAVHVRLHGPRADASRADTGRVVSAEAVYAGRLRAQGAARARLEHRPG